MTTFPFLDTLHTEVVTLQAQFSDLADAIGRASALLADGRLFPEEDGRSTMVRSSDGEHFYFVNGHCGCKTSSYHQGPCKHRLALRLYQKVCDRLAEEATERWTLDLDADIVAAEAPALGPVTIPTEYFTSIQGRPFMKFEGLLHLAHDRGLVELSTTVVSVSDSLADGGHAGLCPCPASGAAYLSVQRRGAWRRSSRVTPGACAGFPPLELCVVHNSFFVDERSSSCQRIPL